MAVTKVFRTKNAEELALCLRLMHADKIIASVSVTETDNGEIMYEISATADDNDILALERRYQTLIG